MKHSVQYVVRYCIGCETLLKLKIKLLFVAVELSDLGRVNSWFSWIKRKVIDLSFWRSVRVKKTRKDHHCVCCGIKIPKGTSCTYDAGIFEGDFQSQYICDDCQKWVNDNRDRLDDDGFYWESVCEMLWDDLRETCKDECVFWDSENRECSFEPKCPAKFGKCKEFKKKGGE
jgi:hypothetical protein